MVMISKIRCPTKPKKKKRREGERWENIKLDKFLGHLIPSNNDLQQFRPTDARNINLSKREFFSIRPPFLSNLLYTEL